MPDFEEMVAALRADCAARPLAPPAQLRQVGDRRIHRRRVVLSGSAATAVTGIAVAAVLVLPGGGGNRNAGPGNGASTPAPVSTPATTGVSSSSAPSPSTPSPSVPSSATPARTSTPSTGGTSTSGATPTCRAAQFGHSLTAQTGAAMGTLGLTVTVTNESTSTCRLDGVPVLWHTETGHSAAVVPNTSADNGPVLLKPGGQSAAVFEWVDGYGGYDPSNPVCAHPVQYHNLSLAVGGGLFPLSGVTIDLQCAGVSAQSWQ